ncbi:MAG: FKBP-type peptidyl-prolyl cis-trans isomerase [Barnesiella sp.]|nr:FKBP-type peptidyl-prolyl cis-trans isomerase [Barnesiella sp. GGCC_0306]MBS7038818.1 FKBP-type peptidyl-prolyl cis-trans isomerase [Bacteroidales bacterium]
MKKSVLVTVMAAGVLSLVSCQNKSAGALTTDADSASYAFGLLNGERIAQAIKADPSGINSEEFMKGFAQALNNDSSKFSFEIGFSQGSQARQYFESMSKQYGAELDKALFLEAYKKAVLGDTAFVIKSADAQAIFSAYMEAAQEKKVKEEEAKLAEAPAAKENLAKGQAFLAEKAKDPAVMKTESGLLYKVIKPGNGTKLEPTDRVKLNYKGSLIDGTEFDSNKDVTFGLNQGIKGWNEGLLLMSPGAKYELYIPADLAYGIRGAGDKIPANSTLVFEVEILELVK